MVKMTSREREKKETPVQTTRLIRGAFHGNRNNKKEKETVPLPSHSQDINPPKFRAHSRRSKGEYIIVENPPEKKKE